MKDVQAFLDSVKEDRSVQDRLHGAKDEQAFICIAAEVATERGWSLTKAEFEEFITERRAQLPDEQLEKVAGGTGGGKIDFGDLSDRLPIDRGPNTHSDCPNPYTNSNIYPGVC